MALWSLRRAIVAGCLLLVCLPLVLLGFAYGYERWIVNRYQHRLRAAAREMLDGKAAPNAGRRGVDVRVLDAAGQVGEIRGSDGSSRGREPSFFGGWAERLLEEIATGVQPEQFPEVDRGFGAVEGRDEVRRALQGETVFTERISASGQTMIFSLATPRPEGGVLYVEKAS